MDERDNNPSDDALNDDTPDDGDMPDLPPDWAGDFPFDLSNMPQIPGMPDPSQLAEQMRQFLSDDGNIDMNKLMGGLRAALGQATIGTDPVSGMNWTSVTASVKRLVAAQGDDPQPSRPSNEMLDAFGLANLWLNEVMTFDGTTLRLELWNRARWVDKTMSAWRSMCVPIVARLGDALIELASENLSAGAAAVPELASMAELVGPMMRSTASEFYSARLSRAVADLAGTTLSGTDAALPLVTPPVVALLPHNIAAFTAGLVAPPTDTGVYLLMRESARQRLFGATPWLGPQILALIEHYSREITIDPATLREGFELDQLDQMTPQRLAEISSQVEDRLFRPATSPDQQAILTRLETLISLVEGWVDTVVAQASGPWLASAPALAETMQRRRAAQGPAERALSTLVGLNLSSRRVRDAANLWAYLGHERGIQERDALWRHPDMLPQAEDLDDVIGFVARTAADAAPDAMDAQLNWLVDQWRKDANG
ncbi:MAG: zinc-dependent metalloprotease [Propionibacteriaceae bacterium]|nr:zinc-dependent metalloprotease [Propionibacteriaceae bacterium]